MLIYVINKYGKPLMPCNERKTRILLKEKKAKVINRTPFTIQLLYGSSGYKQEIILGMDTGSKHIGVSAVTDKKELYSGEIRLRTDIVDLIATRRENRRTRRNRFRYRKARFDNRVHSKKKGWLAPSIENKIQTHFKVVETIHKILPIAKIIIETASFDLQKIKNPNIEGKEYQEGEQFDFWNVREYILFRDNHLCQYCKGKSKDKILNVHHMESRKIGGNAPNNLITLCETCHKKYHKGEIQLKVERGISLKDAAFMGIMRWSFYNRLKEEYKHVSMTYGYITKNIRIKNNLPKGHNIDAFCITGHVNVKRLGYYFYQKQIRRHNRQIHKANIRKGGKKKLNQAAYLVKGFRLFDKVEYEGKECYIFGRRKTGYFDIRTLDGDSIHKSASYKKLRLLERRKGLLTERRESISSPD